MQSTIISESELKGTLEAIREELNDVELKNIRNTQFFNIESVYNYIDELRSRSGKSISRLMELMETVNDYIVFNISNEEISDLINCDQDTFKKQEAYFESRSKIEFINAVLNAKTAKEWRKLVDTCLMLRQLNEEDEGKEF